MAMWCVVSLDGLAFRYVMNFENVQSSRTFVPHAYEQQNFIILNGVSFSLYSSVAQC